MEPRIQAQVIQTIECRRTTQRQTKQLGLSVAGSLVEIHVSDVTGSVNKTNLIARLVLRQGQLKL